MNDNTIERMKQLIEEKKNKNVKKENKRPSKCIGYSRGAKRSKKSGGLFDK